ncbi:MAG: hypothetical protein MJE68_00060, partial [Proteobacteria bacterium]|nr:hypothetical protein [Pseudomonadota bacterium]
MRIPKKKDTTQPKKKKKKTQSTDEEDHPIPAELTLPPPVDNPNRDETAELKKKKKKKKTQRTDEEDRPISAELTLPPPADNPNPDQTGTSFPPEFPHPDEIVPDLVPNRPDALDEIVPDLVDQPGLQDEPHISQTSNPPNAVQDPTPDDAAGSGPPRPPIPPLPLDYQNEPVSDLTSSFWTININPTSTVKDLEKQHKEIKKQIAPLQQQLNKLYEEQAHIESCRDFFETDATGFMNTYQ